MDKTNIKNLPLGDYFTEMGCRQTYAWRVTRRTPKTIRLCRVKVKSDPDFKPQIGINRLRGQNDTRHEQTWLFAGIDRRTTKIIRPTKSGWRGGGMGFLEGAAWHFLFLDS